MSKRHAQQMTLARRPRNKVRAANKVQSLRAQLADCLIAEDLSGAVEVLRGTLTATKHQPCGKLSTIEVPDHSSRLAAAKLILEYAVGKPATVVELPDVPEDGGVVTNATPAEVVRRLKNSGLNLLDIVDAYDNSSEVLDVDEEDEVFEERQDERIAEHYLY